MTRAMPVSVPRRGFRFCKHDAPVRDCTCGYYGFSPPEGISVLQVCTNYRLGQRSVARFSPPEGISVLQVLCPNCHWRGFLEFQSPGGDFGSARIATLCRRATAMEPFQSPGGDFGSASLHHSRPQLDAATHVSVPRRGFRFCKLECLALYRSQAHLSFSPPEGISVLQADLAAKAGVSLEDMFQSPGGDFGSASAQRPTSLRLRATRFSPPEGISVLQARAFLP